jgi:hypothetical protein
MTGGLTPLAPDDNQEQRTLCLEQWATVASAADLARKATALADRYDALPDSGDARASRRRESVARLRAAAASAQRLITALLDALPPESTWSEQAPPSALRRSEPADARDTVAARRDTAAEARDLEASMRDRQARRVGADLDPGFAHRFLSARDRDEAAGDRAVAFEDRRAARDDRVQADEHVPSSPAEVGAGPHSLFERLDAGRTFHQAQGMLMARSGMSADEAFEALLLTSEQQGVSLPETAARLVQDWPEPDPVRTALPASTSAGPAPPA